MEDLHAKIVKQEHTNKIPTVPQPPGKPSFNLPCGDLLLDRKEYLNIGVPLYEASITGDWEAAEAILEKRPELVRYAITENYDTPLHIVATIEETKLTVHFMKQLINRMEKSDLEYQNKTGNTAFSLASAAGNVEMVRSMAELNCVLHGIPGCSGMMPLYMSALFGKHSTVKYLYEISKKMTGDLWTDQNRGWVLQKCVECDYFDVALKIVMDNPTLLINKGLGSDVLGVLARKPDAFNKAEETLITRINKSIIRVLQMKVGSGEEDSDALKLLKIIWSHTIKMHKDEVNDILRGPRVPFESTSDRRQQYPSRILFVATEMGNTRFVVEILRAYPDLIWKINDDGYSIFHVAVMNRYHDIHNLLYEIGALKDLLTPLKDENGNNMLHLVGMTSVKMRPKMPSASLLMQRELLWFKEVEKLLPPTYRQRKNNAGQTPYELFSEVNTDIVLQGLKWMKDCMVVATLIVTVAFAVAFTVPGGYNQQNGIPIFIHGTSFLVFVIADAISLFFSTTSLLVFLCILTSRHGERDFMYSLPKKLMIGLVSLFISVVAMMVTFSASFFVLYHKGLKWVPILIAGFACVPVIIFAALQFPMLVDMFRSMYDSHYLFKPKKRTLYNTNPRL